jgi:iron(III) transport system substrate-binding protein
MKRAIFSCILLIAGISLLLAAPGRQADPGAPPTALTVWSAAADDEAEALVAAFNVHHPNIRVSTIRAGSGALITRLNAEQPRPQGDILLGIAKESFDGNINLFRPYRSVNHNLIPANVRDTGNPPRYYGYSMPLQAFIVNTNLLTPAQYPRTWRDLADPRYRREIILSNPALSGSAYAQIYMIYKLYGNDVLRAVAENSIIVASSTAVPESVARGEYAIGVTGEGNIAEYILRGAPVTYVYPEDGTGARFDASGIIANGPNPRAAELFMDFMTSREAFEIILNVRSRRVVIPGLPGPGPLPPLDAIVLFDYDAEEAADMREELTERFSNWIR